MNRSTTRLCIRYGDQRPQSDIQLLSDSLWAEHQALRTLFEFLDFPSPSSPT